MLYSVRFKRKSYYLTSVQPGGDNGVGQGQLEGSHRQWRQLVVLIWARGHHHASY